MIRDVLTRRREYGTYLQLMKAAVPAESYVIHLSSLSLVSCDVYGQQPGRCRTLSSLLRDNHQYPIFESDIVIPLPPIEPITWLTSYAQFCRTMRTNSNRLSYKQEGRSTQLESQTHISNVLTRRREYGTYLATARRHRRRLKMQKRDE